MNSTLQSFQIERVTPSNQQQVWETMRFRFDEYSKHGWLVNIPKELQDMRLDRDKYDNFTALYVNVRNQGQIIATQRLIRYPNPFMIEHEYEGGLCNGIQLDYGKHVAEVSRLAVEQKWSNQFLPLFPNCTVHHFLFREMYRYCREQGISKIYTATLAEKTNAFRSLGLPLISLRQKRLFNGDIIDLVSLNWNDFLAPQQKNQAMLDWYLA